MVDRSELKKTWDLFVGENGFTEVRILGKFQYSGYFRSFENLCTQLEPYTEMDEEQIYFVMNEISPDCYARTQCEKFVKSPKATTKDEEIIRRKFLLCDFDPIRKANISSTPEQFELAHRKSQEMFRFLRSNGFSEPVVAISGSGWHLLIPVDIECNDETDKIVKDFYAYMYEKFSDDAVEYDPKVFNRSRITKLYSTVAKKGANLPTNPWRQSKVVYIPSAIVPTPLEKIKEFADLAPQEEPKTVPTRSYRQYVSEPFDLTSWLNEHGINFREKANGTGTQFELEYCPWVDTHSDRKKWDSALFRDADGKITFNCTHAHCAGKTWHDVRLYYQPDAYEKPLQPLYRPPIGFQQRQYTPPPVKPETEEKGKKWRTMKDIQKINILDIPHFDTGFRDLDRRLKGLFLGEVTIVSGSNSSGKSSWLNSLILNAVQQDIRTALWSGELRDDVLKTWIQMVAAGKSNLRPTQYGDYFYVPDAVGERIDNWMGDRFVMYNKSYSSSWAQLFADMKMLIPLGFKFFILDNLMALDIDIVEGDNNKKQKALIGQICDFAKTNMIHIILVAHPRKTTDFLRKNDISGNSDLSNAVDNVLIVHRVNNDFKKAGAEFFGKAKIETYFDYGNVVVVEKNRLLGVQDEIFGMYYEVESRRFKNEVDEQIHYGWEDPPKQAEMQFAPSPQPNNDLPFPLSDGGQAPF